MAGSESGSLGGLEQIRPRRSVRDRESDSNLRCPRVEQVKIIEFLQRLDKGTGSERHHHLLTGLLQIGYTHPMAVPGYRVLLDLKCFQRAFFQQALRASLVQSQPDKCRGQ